MAHPNGVKSFRSVSGRGHKGMSYRFSRNYLQRSINGVTTGSIDVRLVDTAYESESAISGMGGLAAVFSAFPVGLPD